MVKDISIFDNIDSKLLSKFKAYHNANPHIFREFIRNAMEMKASGRTKSSAWLIINKIRWDHHISTDGQETFKISNDYIALYPRLLIYNRPEFDGFFTLKKMKSNNRVLSGDEYLDSKECNTL